MSSEFEQSFKQIEELVGTKAELVISSGLYKGSYPSRIEDFENNLIGVSHPLVRGALLPALRSTELLMKIEASTCFYQVMVSVVRSSVNVSPPLLWLKLLGPAEKVQRRMSVRVPCSLKADLFFLGIAEDPPEGTSLPPKEWFSLRVSDISLGGVGISIKKEQSAFCLEGGRYLLSMSIGSESFFVVAKLSKILRRNETFIELGLAYEGVPVFTEKLMGSFIRQQELVTRG